jgi:antitoxin (DNA-binding transcriptional repressor) of toxin-antitoxin stability system
MTQQISQRELRNDSGAIMRGLEAGQTYVVSRHGHPVGELRPLRRQQFVGAEAAVEMFRRAPALDWAQIRDDLDAVVDQDAEPRG